MKQVITIGSVLLISWGCACGEDPQGAQNGVAVPLSGSYATGIPPVGSSAGTAAAGTVAPVVPSVAVAGTGASPSTLPPLTAAGSAAPPPTVPGQPLAPGEESAWCGVKRTLDSKCTACHDEKGTAGTRMSLKTYADTQLPAPSDNTKKVFQVMGTRVHDTKSPMPPQGQLTTEQLTGVDTWIAGGAVAGADPTCANSAPEPVSDDGWTWPTNCDATYKLLSHAPGGADQPYQVAASQESHPQVAITSPWGDEAMQMIAWRAVTDNPKVLHHWILYGQGREFIVGWAPGKEHNAPLPADVGLRFPSGNFTLDMHYNNLQGAKVESDHSGVEVCMVKQANFRANTAAVFSGFSSFGINIPAHATNFDVTGNCSVTAREPVHLVSASPHAHKLANHMKFTVTHEDGTITMLHDAAFNFEEQAQYSHTPIIDLKTGDKVTTVCTFSNPGNTTVTFGENTGNEMCFNFAVYYPIGALSCSGRLGTAFPTF